jgi:hypothetical protein
VKPPQKERKALKPRSGGAGSRVSAEEDCQEPSLTATMTADRRYLRMVEFIGKTRLQMSSYRVRILTHRAFAGMELQPRWDEYMVSWEPSGSLDARSLRTGHHHDIPVDSIIAFFPDRNNSPSGLQRGCLKVAHELWQSNLGRTWRRPSRHRRSRARTRSH